MSVVEGQAGLSSQEGRSYSLLQPRTPQQVWAQGGVGMDTHPSQHRCSAWRPAPFCPALPTRAAGTFKHAVAKRGCTAGRASSSTPAAPGSWCRSQQSPPSLPARPPCTTAECYHMPYETLVGATGPRARSPGKGLCRCGAGRSACTPPSSSRQCSAPLVCVAFAWGPPQLTSLCLLLTHAHSARAPAGAHPQAWVCPRRPGS